MGTGDGTEMGDWDWMLVSVGLGGGVVRDVMLCVTCSGMMRGLCEAGLRFDFFFTAWVVLMR
jgi:hypothetical protein